MPLLLVLLAAIFGGFALLGVISDRVLPALVPALADEAECGTGPGLPPASRIGPAPHPARPAARPGRAAGRREASPEFALSG